MLPTAVGQGITISKAYELGRTAIPKLSIQRCQRLLKKLEEEGVLYDVSGDDGAGLRG